MSGHVQYYLLRPLAIRLGMDDFQLAIQGIFSVGDLCSWIFKKGR